MHRLFAQNGLRDGGKAKEQVSSNLCSTKAVVHWWPCQLYGQIAQESSKKEVGLILGLSEFCSNKTVCLW